MPPTLDTNAAIKLTRLAAKARAVTTELAANPAYPEEKRPSTIGKIAKGVATVGGLGAAGYGVGSYLRGRKIMSPVGGGIGGHLDVLKAGNSANIADAGNFARLAGAKINAAGKTATSKAEELRRRLGASLAGGRNAAARAIATTPIKPTYSVD